MRAGTTRAGNPRGVPAPGQESAGSDRQPPVAPPSETLERYRIQHLDEERLEVYLIDWEESLLLRVKQRIATGSFQLPQLPAAHMRAMQLAGSPAVEIRDLVDEITRDPVLSSELLRLANSPVYTARAPAASLHEAVLRIGLRGLRGMLLSASMRAVLVGGRDLGTHAGEVWRQAFSMASIAREIAALAALDPDEAFMLGLLHDVGKIPLLGILREELPKGRAGTRALIGRTFIEYHEAAGARLAQSWKLPEDLEAVIGQHHDYRSNARAPRGAAFASLVHKVDLLLSLGAESEFRALARADEMEALAIPEEARPQLLMRALKAFKVANKARQVQPPPAAGRNGLMDAAPAARAETAKPDRKAA